MEKHNIDLLIETYEADPDLFMSHYRDAYSVDLQKHEIETLISLVKNIKGSCPDIYLENFSYFYLSYKIPQIGKEFDLLRLGENYNLNIELKKESNEKKILKQLLKNDYYLKSLGDTNYLFTYVLEDKKICQLQNDTLVDVDIYELVELIKNQEVLSDLNINNLFEPTEFLVSPFNTTDNFIKNHYFLTDHQIEIKKNILNNLKSEILFSIEGAAGTGKTLLTYDIAKHIKDNLGDPLIVHCAQLNEGHSTLKLMGWAIIPIKELQNKITDLKEYQAIIIDEAQRLYPHQLDLIIKETKKHNVPCIFSYDRSQYLGSHEQGYLQGSLTELKTSKHFALTEKIRSNKEIASFIKYLYFPHESPNKLKPFTKIKIQNIASQSSLRDLCQYLSKDGWEIINYTTSQYKWCPLDEIEMPFVENNPHKAIGQEYDKVAVIIDPYFDYKDGKMIYTKDTYYLAPKMLFQILTRARKQIYLIFLKNKEIYKRSLEILQAGNS